MLRIGGVRSSKLTFRAITQFLTSSGCWWYSSGKYSIYRMRGEKQISGKANSPSRRRRRSQKYRTPNHGTSQTSKAQIVVSSSENLLQKLNKNSHKISKKSEEKNCLSIQIHSKLSATQVIAERSSKSSRKPIHNSDSKNTRDKKGTTDTTETSRTSKGAVTKSDKATPSRPSNPLRFKTELCRAHEEGGFCRFGQGCAFAHGAEELRSVPRHHKYKTEECRSYHSVGYCQYGIRCHFIHDSEESSALKYLKKPEIKYEYDCLESDMDSLLESIGVHCKSSENITMNRHVMDSQQNTWDKALALTNFPEFRTEQSSKRERTPNYMDMLPTPLVEPERVMFLPSENDKEFSVDMFAPSKKQTDMDILPPPFVEAQNACKESLFYPALCENLRSKYSYPASPKNMWLIERTENKDKAARNENLSFLDDVYEQIAYSHNMGRENIPFVNATSELKDVKDKTWNNFLSPNLFQLNPWSIDSKDMWKRDEFLPHHSQSIQTQPPILSVSPSPYQSIDLNRHISQPLSVPMDVPMSSSTSPALHLPHVVPTKDRSSGGYSSTSLKLEVLPLPLGMPMKDEYSGGSSSISPVREVLPLPVNMHTTDKSPGGSSSASAGTLSCAVAEAAIADTPGFSWNLSQVKEFYPKSYTT